MKKDIEVLIAEERAQIICKYDKVGNFALIILCLHKVMTQLYLVFVLCAFFKFYVLFTCRRRSLFDHVNKIDRSRREPVAKAKVHVKMCACVCVRALNKADQ